jgi:hypothetical protein
MRMQFTVRVVFPQASTTTRRVEKESKPRDHTVLLEEMCSQASFASEGLLTTHTCMLILKQCCILTFFNLVLFPVKTTGMHRFKGLSESLMKLDHTMMPLSLKDGVFSTSPN